MDNCEIIDLEDGKGMTIIGTVYPATSIYLTIHYAETYSGNPVKNAWKINNEKKNKWYILYSKDRSVKEAWMEAFVRERQRVQDDESSSEHTCLVFLDLWLIIVYQ